MSQAALPSASASQIRFKSRRTRQFKDRAFVGVCLVAASASVAALVTLLTSIIAQSMGFQFDHWFPSLLLGIAVLTTAASAVTIGMLVPPLIRRTLTARQRTSLIGALVVLLASLALFAYLWQIRQGTLWLTWQFLKGVPSRFPEQAGIWPAIIGTIMICAVCALTAIPIGVATAILLEEFRPRSRWLRRPHAFVQLNVTNLAGVPSIVYGILGLTVFVQMFNAFGTQLDPSFEFGVTYHDRFVTEGGRMVQVAVPHRDAPPADPAAIDQWQDLEGQPVDIELVDREAILPQLTAVDDALDAFEDEAERIMSENPDLDAAGLAAALEPAWAQAGLKGDFASVQADVVAGLLEVRDLSGREARRARRAILKTVESAERTARFSGVLITDSVPARIGDTAPWYFRIPFGRGVLAGGLTLMLVVLPIVIISTQEALRSVPRSMRYASLALGATPWQTVWKITLPTAIPGIMTGTILAMSRAIGEAAPILVIAGIVYITFTPSHLMDDFTAMPLQIFNWASRPQADFHKLAAAGIVVLMAILLLFNATAVIIRQRTQKQY